MRESCVLFMSLWLPALLLASGCISGRPSPAQPPPAQAVTAPPPTPLPGLIVTEVEPKKEREQVISFSLRDADVRELFMALAKQIQFNIVVDPDVQGRITVDLKNVTLNEALDIITDLVNITYRVKGNVIRVSRPKIETRIFSLQYVNTKRSATSQISAQIGAGSTVTGTVTTGTTAGAGTGTQSISTTTDTELWKQIEDGLKTLVSKEGGSYVLDRMAGSIMVTDFPKSLDRIASFIETVEGSVQRQVAIEAKVIEVTLTDEYKFGLNWGAIAKAGALRGASAASVGNIIGQKLAADGGIFQIGVTSANFDFLLDAMSKQGSLNILSSPRVSTLNNQTAIIKAGTDEVFFETRITAATTTTPETRTVTPRTVTVGVVLGVTPQISSDGTIVMHVHPTVSEKQGTAKSSVGDTFPILNVRETDTVVRVREGQVLVIAGLMQEKMTGDETRVPLISDIPVLGHLFRQDTRERRKTELVILLSPTVLVGKKIDEVTARDLERLERAKRRSP